MAWYRVQFFNQIPESGECRNKALEQQHPAMTVEDWGPCNAQRLSMSKTIYNLLSFGCVLFLAGNSKCYLVLLITEKNVQVASNPSNYQEIHYQVKLRPPSLASKD